MCESQHIFTINAISFYIVTMFAVSTFGVKFITPDDIKSNI